MASNVFTLLRQIVPVVIGSLLGVSFGSMLGWPSITFPLLVDPEITPIIITWDQSAMIAGFLMEGNIIGTAFSSITCLGSKTGVIVSCCCQIAGWIAMYFAQSIPGIGISRGLVGFGSGFGLGQLRIYAEQSCHPNIFQLLMQYMPLSINVGVILVYSVGGFVSFRVLSLICVIVPIVNLCLFTAIPKKIVKTSDRNTLEAIETVYQTKTSPEEKKSDDTNPTTAENAKPTQLSFIGAIKDRKIRYSFLLLWFLIFIPQYTGGAANIVYSQVVHIAALNPYPKVCSVVYSFVFLFSNIVALKYTNKFPRKPILIASCLICSLLLCSVCFYFYYLIDLLEFSTLFVWSPLFLLCIFNFFHTVGVNTIPILLINDKFPINARIVASKFYVMYFSLSAVISTKIFQVVFTYCGMHMAYVFLSSVGVGCAIIVFLFVKEPSNNKINPKLDGFTNEVDLNDEIPYNANKRDWFVKEPSNNKINLKMDGFTNEVDLSDEIPYNANKRDFSETETRTKQVPQKDICPAVVVQDNLSFRDEIVTCRL